MLVLMKAITGHGRARQSAGKDLPSISIVLPVHNEMSVIEEKMRNLLHVRYPKEQMEIVVVSDGSSDETATMVNRYTNERVILKEQVNRLGKAAALNLGLMSSSGEIIIFTDASLILEDDAIEEIVRPFEDQDVGCVSGEDHIGERNGEGMYGRYELFLRRQESDAASLVGASGSFYAQRRALCETFQEGMAPDFLSVLVTVEKGFRAVAAPRARGSMGAVKSAGAEFERKTRTVLRGMATLAFKRRLLNPFRYGMFSIQLWSHKILRWCVPFLLIVLAVTNVFLLDQLIYRGTFAAQMLLYALFLLSAAGVRYVRESTIGRIAQFFVLSNAAILMSWFMLVRGKRIEIWAPSRR